MLATCLPARPSPAGAPRLPRRPPRPARLPALAYAGPPYGEIKSAAEAAYERAAAALPQLERAQAAASQAREPAADAERRWQEAHSRVSEVQGQAHAALQEVRAGAEAALGGADLVTAQMLRHHASRRLAAFRAGLGEVSLWRDFAPDERRLSWLPGAAMAGQVAACVSGGEAWVVAVVAVARPPLDDSLRGVLLHWGVADGPGAGWMGAIPQGWRTEPGVSQPCGATAWETGMAAHAPVLEGEPATSAVVHSVLIQVPMQGETSAFFVCFCCCGGCSRRAAPWSRGRQCLAAGTHAPLPPALRQVHARPLPLTAI
jgi:hypothetical protein